MPVSRGEDRGQKAVSRGKRVSFRTCCVRDQGVINRLERGSGRSPFDCLSAHLVAGFYEGDGIIAPAGRDF
jgi:hypothetical protein